MTKSKIHHSGNIKDPCNWFRSSEHIYCILNWLRKQRTLSLKLAFPILIAEDILTGKKPHELNPFENISAMATIGVILILCGALLRFWARGHFVRGRLFTSGPYALVRHPLYLGSFLTVLGILFLLNDWINWLVLLSLFAVFYGAAIIYEERSLEKHFGLQWRTYKAKVPAIIPSLRRNWPLRNSSPWSWQVFLSTGELIGFLAIVSLPILIELLEECMF